MKNKDPNAMFTLDEEDYETEYGESFKTNSMTGSNVYSKMNQLHNIREGDNLGSDEEEDEDDIDPDLRYESYGRVNRNKEFGDEGIYQITMKDVNKASIKGTNNEIKAVGKSNTEKKKIDNIKINVHKAGEMENER